MPPGEIRPAMSRMRESLFAAIEPLDGMSFLDLFSGSGLVGLEAYSRGARPVYLVERDRGKRKVLGENIRELTEPPTVRIVPAEAFIKRNRMAFQIIYLDPPFAYEHKSQLIERLARSPSVAEEQRTRIIMHHPSSETLAVPSDWQIEDLRRYGGSTVTIMVPTREA